MKDSETRSGAAVSSSDLVRRLIVLDDWPHLKCPYEYNGVPCEGVPHMSASLTGLNMPPESSSGAGLQVKMSCESGHEWVLRIIDHSAGLWLEVIMPNSDGEKRSNNHEKDSQEI